MRNQESRASGRNLMDIARVGVARVLIIKL